MKFKKEARYLKNNSLTPQEKTAKIQTDQIHMVFGSIISCFSFEWDLSENQLFTSGTNSAIWCEPPTDLHTFG